MFVPDRSGLDEARAAAPRGPDTSPGRDPLTVAPSQPARGVILLRMGGELDLLTVPRARRVLAGAVDAVAAELAHQEQSGGAAPGCVLCDLEGLDFLGASGLGMLVEVAEYARPRGVELVLVAATGPAARVLVLTGLDAHFVMAPSADPVPAPRSGGVATERALTPARRSRGHGE